MVITIISPPPYIPPYQQEVKPTVDGEITSRHLTQRDTNENTGKERIYRHIYDRASNGRLAVEWMRQEKQ